MTKKHFKMLAEALRDSNASTAVVSAVMRVCKQINPRFDQEKFLSAVYPR